ncbi:MAG: SDR family NAD(P)-dependent oxidoreductase [Aureliella sp.]
MTSPIAFVTGSSSGIGAATAVELARRGFDLIVHARTNVSGAQAVAEQVQEHGQSVIVLTGDIATSQTCVDLIKAAFSWQGRLDALINLAGFDSLTGDHAALSFDEKLTRLLDIDVRGTVQMCRAFYERIANDQQAATTPPYEDQPKHLPCVINIGWDQANTAMEGTPGQLFCTTKAAVEAFTKAFALTCEDRIRVNLVAPGWIQTKWSGQASDYWSKRATSESLSGRWGRPKDVAQTIGWLCSREAEFINAQVISVNGGLRHPPLPNS